MSEGDTDWVLPIKSVKEHPPDIKRTSSEISDIFLKELPMKYVREHPPDAKRISIEFSDGFSDEVPVPDPPWQALRTW